MLWRSRVELRRRSSTLLRHSIRFASLCKRGCARPEQAMPLALGFVVPHTVVFYLYYCSSLIYFLKVMANTRSKGMCRSCIHYSMYSNHFNAGTQSTRNSGTTRSLTGNNGGCWWFYIIIIHVLTILVQSGTLLHPADVSLMHTGFCMSSYWFFGCVLVPQKRRQAFVSETDEHGEEIAPPGKSVIHMVLDLCIDLCRTRIC